MQGGQLRTLQYHARLTVEWPRRTDANALQLGCGDGIVGHHLRYRGDDFIQNNLLGLCAFCGHFHGRAQHFAVLIDGTRHDFRAAKVDTYDNLLFHLLKILIIADI